jgi:hypothetical protein
LVLSFSGCWDPDRRLLKGSHILLKEEAIGCFAIVGRGQCCVVAAEVGGEDVVTQRDGDDEENG